MSKKKQKKDTITYIDDGRNIADMSGIHDRFAWAKKGTTSSFKDIWNTYWNAVRMMFLPMLVVLGFIVVIYLIITIIFWLI